VRPSGARLPTRCSTAARARCPAGHGQRQRGGGWRQPEPEHERQRSLAYNSKDVLTANQDTSAASGDATLGHRQQPQRGQASLERLHVFSAPVIAPVAATVTPKTVKPERGQGRNDGTTDLTGRVALGNLVGSETLGYTGAQAQ